MKPTKLRFSIISLMATASMVLASCGGTTATNTPVPPVATTAPTAMAADTVMPATAMPANTAMPATAMPGGGDKGTIKLVSSLPRTGLSKPQTDDIVAGINMALTENNNTAGGYKIVYEDLDDATAQTGKWDAATESGNATKAVDDPDVMVYLGTFNSGAAKVSIPILNKAGLAMISPANTAPELTKAGFDDATLSTLYDTSKPRNYFRVVTADDVQGVAAAKWAIELGFKKVYVVNDQEVYGKGVANQFEKQFKASGGTVVTNEGIEKSQGDYKTLMTKVKDSGADLLYFGGLVDDGGPQIAKDLKAVAPSVQFMGPDGILTQTFIDAAGAAVTEGMYGTVAGRQAKDLPAKGAKFYTDFKAKMGKDPDPYAIFGYDAAAVALDAINRAGTKDRAAIIKALSETKDYEGALGKWSFDANGDTTLPDIQGFKVANGKWEFQKYVTASETSSGGGNMGTDKGTIKLVSSLPRTGLSKPQTDDIVAGINMALAERDNAAGGYKIVYEDLDDATAQTGKWDAATESGNATKAVDDPDVMVYLGTFNSGAAKVSIPILNKAGLAMISPANTAPELTKAGFDDATLGTLFDTSKPRNYFRVVTADDVQGVAAAKWAIELGFKKVYVVNDQEVYGKGVANQFEKQFKASGGTVVTNEGIEKSQGDYKTLMTKVKDSGADLLYFGGLVDDGGPQIAKDLKAVAPNVQFMGPDGILTQTFIDAAGASVTEGMYGTVAGRQAKDLPGKGAKFYTDFKAKMGKDPDPYAIFGYDAANVALDAINRAGTKDRAAIIKAISETKDFEGALGKWSFDANGDTTLSDIQGFKAMNGKWEFQKYVSEIK